MMAKMIDIFSVKTWGLHLPTKPLGWRGPWGLWAGLPGGYDTYVEQRSKYRHGHSVSLSEYFCLRVQWGTAVLGLGWWTDIGNAPERASRAPWPAGCNSPQTLAPQQPSARDLVRHLRPISRGASLSHSSTNHLAVTTLNTFTTKSTWS